MRIKILNGSPRKENTAAMCEAFAEGENDIIGLSRKTNGEPASTDLVLFL